MQTCLNMHFYLSHANYHQSIKCNAKLVLEIWKCNDAALESKENNHGNQSEIKKIFHKENSLNL